MATATPVLQRNTVLPSAAHNHWRNPGWRVLAVAVAIGCVQPFAVYPLAVMDERLFGHSSPPPPLVLWAALTLLPVMVLLEEWLFRGAILRRLVRPLGAIAALAISAALFAAAHGWRHGLLARFVVGLILGTLYLRTQSLWACITAHTVHDVFAFGWLLHEHNL